MRFGADSLDGHLAAILISYLIKSKHINTAMTPLNVFRTALNFLIETDFSTVKLDFSMPSLNNNLSNYSETALCILFPIGVISYNTCWRISQSSLSDIKIQATCCINLLQKLDFQSVFLKANRFFERYDLYLHFPLSEISQDQNGNKSSKDDITSWVSVSSTVVSLLKKGLGDRVALVSSYCFPFGFVLADSQFPEKKYNHEMFGLR
jgi:hypothetical protein